MKYEFEQRIVRTVEILDHFPGWKEALLVEKAMESALTGDVNLPEGRGFHDQAVVRIAEVRGAWKATT